MNKFRSLVLLTVFWISISAIPGFAQFTDDFSDGNFTANPEWIGMTDSFEVSNGQLRSKAGGAGNLYLATAQPVLAQTWEFFFRMAFNPSSGNYMEFWLAADNANLNEAQNGYFVRLGGNTGDGIGLFKMANGTSTELVLQNSNTLVSGASNNFGNIRVTRNTAGSWEIFQKITSSSFVSFGAAFDNSITTSAFVGLRIVTTRTNRSRHYLDDVIVGLDSPPDLTPPSLVSANIQSPTEIDLQFNEPVDEAFSAQAGNYSISPSLAISSVQRLSNNFTVVRLTFLAPLAPGTYTISVLQSKDLVGNVQSTTQTRDVIFNPPTPTAYRSIVINEIMAAPSNSAGTTVPQVEWLELFNPGNQAVTMQGWTIRDASTAAPRVIPTTTIPALGYVVLVSASSAPLFQGIAQVAAVTLPSLNNDKDSLVLADANGNAIDIVTYADSWYQDNVKKSGGWTLEQINPFLACSGGFNWIASFAPEGGTPGAQNSVFSDAPDEQSPGLVATTFSGNRITFTFSEPLFDAPIPVDSIKISGLQVVAIQNRVPSLDKITVILASPPQTGLVYDVFLYSIRDCQGNRNPLIETSIGQGKAPGRFELLITEIQADNSPDNGLPQAEYFELHNPTPFVIDLSGLTVNAGSTTTGRFPPFLMKPGEYVVVCSGSSVPLFTGVKAVGITSFPALSQDGSRLILKNASGRWIHQMFYRSADFSPLSLLNAGWSLEMVDLQNRCDQRDNWAVSTAPAGGTPGKLNSVARQKPDLTAPGLVSAFVQNANLVKITWNELIDSVALYEAEITLSNGHSMVEKVISDDFSSLTIRVSPSFVVNQEVRLTIGSVSDCAGNRSAIQTVTIALPGLADSASWMLNEVLFDPKTGGTDYVEIKNISTRYLNLQELSLGNRSETRTIINEPYIVPSGGIVLLTGSKGLTLRDYPRGKVENFVEMTLPSFNADSGTVRLIGPGKKIWQQFFYSDKFHTRILDVRKGVSLERIAPNLPVNNPDSWQSASADVGYGTPGYENSQSRDFDPEDVFSVNPKAFSPNGDGNRDFVFFNYGTTRLNQTGNLRIYAPEGHLVRTLAETANLGSQGFWKWDGTDEKGRKLRIGLYVAVLEVFELGGSTKYYKIPVAIASEN